MDKFFNPSSVVIIGASNSPFNLGASICTILKHLEFEGPVYAVNRRGEDVNSCPGFPSVSDLPSAVDLAVVITPAQAVPGIVGECGEKGIKRLIIESAGFSEEGGGGKLLQEEVSSLARKYGIRFIGPNCLGVMDTHSRFCCFFGFIPGMYDEAFENPGSVSYVIQSGGIGALIMDSFRKDVVSVNKMISIGNKEDIDESDMLEYFNGDNSEVIGLYIESIKDGRKFLETARKVTKPVLIYKVGKTDAGAKAAMSHTAGMANNDLIFDCACRQAGIIRARSIGELHAIPKIFTSMPLLKGRRIAVFTNSGAFGGITADLLVEAGLEMAELSGETRERLAKTGKLFNASNPVDLGPAISMQTFLDIFEILLSSGEVDGLLPVPNVWQQVVIDAIMELVKMCRHFDKPAAIYIPNAVDRIVDIRKKYSLPVFESPEEAVRALRISYTYYSDLTKKKRMQHVLKD